MKNLNLIVAHNELNTIGAFNKLPWSIPEDLQRFKELTMGHHIIMGRNTFESLGRLLPGRTTVIVTRNKEYAVEGAIVVHSIEEAIAACAEDDEPFLIGGEHIYKLGLPHVTRLYITKVHEYSEGDAWFPRIDESQWKVVASVSKKSKSGLSYTDLELVKA